MRALLEREQFAAHGFAWIATYVEALRQMLALGASGWTRPAASARSRR